MADILYIYFKISTGSNIGMVEDNRTDLLLPLEPPDQFRHVAEFFNQNFCCQHLFEGYRNSLNPTNFSAERKEHFFHFSLFRITLNRNEFLIWKVKLETVSDNVDILLSESLLKTHSSKKYCLSLWFLKILPCWI